MFSIRSLFRSLADNSIENGKIAQLVVNREVCVVAVDLHQTHTQIYRVRDRNEDEVVNGDDVFNWMDSIPLKQVMVSTRSNYV